MKDPLLLLVRPPKFIDPDPGEPLRAEVDAQDIDPDPRRPDPELVSWARKQIPKSCRDWAGSLVFYSDYVAHDPEESMTWIPPKFTVRFTPPAGG